MNAQRALELVKQLARKLDQHFPAQELSDEEKAAACQALYHYAEIMQAEAVGYRVGNGLVHGLMANRSENWPINEPLIIKPKPLGQK